MSHARRVSESIGNVSAVDPTIILTLITAVIQLVAQCRGETAPVAAIQWDILYRPEKVERMLWRMCRRRGIPQENRPAVIRECIRVCEDRATLAAVCREIEDGGQPTGEYPAIP